MYLLLLFFLKLISKWNVKKVAKEKPKSINEPKHKQVFQIEKNIQSIKS